MEDEHVDEAISRLSNDLLRLAKEIQYETWKDQDAQNWYIAGIKDSAHLTMLKWIKDDDEQITHPQDTEETSSEGGSKT
jgi:hypothetical protein